MKNSINPLVLPSRSRVHRKLPWPHQTAVQTFSSCAVSFFWVAVLSFTTDADAASPYRLTAGDTFQPEIVTWPEGLGYGELGFEASERHEVSKRLSKKFPKSSFLGSRIAAAALERTTVKVTYDPSYRRLTYPNGDIEPDRGVCSDVIIRSLRKVGLDLQKLVHEDMSNDFSAYPSLWGATRPDSNIDHRRVPNLEVFLTRSGARMPKNDHPRAFKAGDIVAWNLRAASGVLPHIGIVTGVKGPSGWPQTVHNIGHGPQHEDVLLLWPITGHYRISEALLTKTNRPM